MSGLRQRTPSLSQPLRPATALSIQIKQLANALGMPLHEQIGKRLFLTEAGRRVESASRDILDRLDRLAEELAELQGLERGRLRLSIITITVKNALRGRPTDHGPPGGLGRVASLNREIYGKSRSER